MRKAVGSLLAIAHQVSTAMGADAEILDGPKTGVWNSKGKLASIGVHIEKHVLLHGLALNVYPTQRSFSGIKPCGLDAAPAYLCESPSEKKMTECKDLLIAVTLSRFWCQ